MYNLALDESGTIGSTQNQFFILSIFQLDSNKFYKLEKIRIKLYKEFKKELKRNNEIKFYSQSNKFTKKALNRLNKTDFQAYSIVMNKENSLNKRLLKKHSHNQIYIGYGY